MALSPQDIDKLNADFDAKQKKAAKLSADDIARLNADFDAKNTPQQSRKQAIDNIANYEPTYAKPTRDMFRKGISYGWAPIALGLKYMDKPRAMGAAAVNKIITGGKSNWREDVGNNISYGEIIDKGLAKTDLSPKTKRWLGAGLGFAADMALDPVMWFSGGGAAVAKTKNAARAFDALKDAYGAEKALQLIAKTEDSAKLAKTLGIDSKLIKLAEASKGVGMADSLADKAKAGQWAVAHVGKITTPKKFNAKVGGALDKAYSKWINAPIVNRFVHTTGNPELDRRLTKAEMLNKQNERLIDKFAAENMADIAQIEKETGKKVTTSVLEKEGSNWLKGYGTPAQQRLATRIFNFDNAQRLEYNKVSTGKPIKSLLTDDYFPMHHTLANDEWKEAKQAVLRSNGGLPVDKSVNAFQRKYVGIKNPKTGQWEVGNIYEKAREWGVNPGELEIRQESAGTINKLFAEKYPDRFGDKPFFSEDAAGVTKARNINMENANNVGRKIDAFYDFTQNNHAPVDWQKRGGYRLPETLTDVLKTLDDEGKLKPMLSDRITELAATPMNNAMATQLEALMSGLAKGSKQKGYAQRALDMYNKLWIDFTLPLRLRYHSRNWSSDPFNVAMAHGYDEAIKSTWKLPEAYKVLGKKEGVFHSPLYGDISYSDLADKFYDHGIISNTNTNSYNKAVTELENNLVGEATGGNWFDKLERGVNKFDERAKKFGEIISGNGEDARRVSNALRAAEQGMSLEQIADYVNKGLFNYNATPTNLEQKLGKLFLLYKYPRNNMVLQAQTMATHPERLQLLARGKYALESAFNKDPIIPEEKRPSYMRGNMSVQVGKDEGNPNFIQLGNFIGPADAFSYSAVDNKGDAVEELVNSGLNYLVSQAHPLAGGALKYLSNKDFYRDKPIDNMQGAAENLSDLLLGVDRTNYLRQDVGAKVPTLVNMTPVGVPLSEIDRINPFGIFGTERPNRKELTTNQKIASIVPGIRNYNVDMAKHLKWRERDAQKFLRKLEDAEKPDEAKIQRFENRLDQMYNLDDLILRYYGH